MYFFFSSIFYGIYTILIETVKLLVRFYDKNLHSLIHRKKN